MCMGASREGWICSERRLHGSVCVTVRLLGSEWDKVRRELCWLVEGPWGQTGNNTLFYPCLSPHSCLYQSLASTTSLSSYNYSCLSLSASKPQWWGQTRAPPRLGHGLGAPTLVPALLWSGTNRVNVITVPLFSAKRQPVETINCLSN